MIQPLLAFRLLNAEKEAVELRNLLTQSEADLREKEREASEMLASLARAEEDSRALRAQCAQLEQKRADESHQHRANLQARIQTKMTFSFSQNNVEFRFHLWCKIPFCNFNLHVNFCFTRIFWGYFCGRGKSSIFDKIVTIANFWQSSVVSQSSDKRKSGFSRNTEPETFSCEP